MSRVAEQLLLLLFSLTRTACFMVGFALLAALLGVPVVGSDSPGWLVAVFDGSLRVGVILTATGAALQLVRRWTWQTARPEETTADSRRAVWPSALALTLVVLPILALLRSADLVVLWQLVAGLLEQAGFREEFARGGQGSGLVMLPILVALLVPILESVTAFFLIAVPVLLLPPLRARSAGFPGLLAMLVATQIGLAACCLSAVATLGSVVSEAMSSMAASGDAEVLQAAEIAGQLLGLTTSTARLFVLPVLGFALWLPFVVLAAGPRAWFVSGEPGPHPSA